MCICLCLILVLKSDANRECSWRAFEFSCHPIWQPKTAIHATGERRIKVILHGLSDSMFTLVISDFYNLSYLTLLIHFISMTLTACCTYQKLAKSNLFSHCASLITEFKAYSGTRMKIANLAGVVRWLWVCTWTQSHSQLCGVFWCGILHLGLPRFWTLSIIQYSRNLQCRSGFWWEVEVGGTWWWINVGS